MAMDKKVVLITGSTSGIGLEIARCFAQQNAHVILNGLGEPRVIAHLTYELNQLGTGTVVHCAANLMEVEEIHLMMEFVQDTFHGLDILINNAGMQHVEPIETFSPEKWNQIIALNLSACFHTIQKALTMMRKRKWGRILNIASTYGLVASPHKAAYVASKHGLVGLTKVVALETSQEHITCNAICPGWIKPSLGEPQTSALSKQKNISLEQAESNLLKEKQPSSAFIAPDQIGNLCLFLCQEYASHITGAALPIDGGWTSQ